ncbi:DMT family transporter [Corynebacterium timonense]|uniref:Transporter family-2 protein n=1 Tax=Corynebacterium timonense TaxID=441500 RepID=A0A1H1MAG2_9CORY|nr:DMT family transporter [Corynebacterium timonense]SDR83365.1 transporter family-2 protein [Corynebacterium timonense]
MLALLVAITVGAIIPIQSAANTRLRLSVGDKPLVSALISFSLALAVSIVATTALQGNPIPDLAAASGAGWWVWLGGVMGVCFIVGNILLFPRIGAVQTMVLPILGQLVMGLLVDRLGLFGAPVHSVTPGRLIGALVVLGGIALVLNIGRAAGPAQAAGPQVWAWRALGVAIGMGSATQTTVNGVLGTMVGSSLHAAEVNLFVGAVLLLVLVCASSPRQLGRAPQPGPWWMWLGGVVGATFVIAGATLAPVLGTATTVIAFNAGTILGGQVMESVGAFGARKRPLDARRVAGLVLVFAGVLMVRLL